MTTETLATGPDPQAITRTILETWPETDPALTEAHDRLAAQRARHRATRAGD